MTSAHDWHENAKQAAQLSFLTTMSARYIAALVLACLVLRCCCHGARAKSALLVVDVQGCFLPGGPLAVQGDGPVVAAINGLKQHGGFDLVVWTQDWHPPHHVSFAPTHSKQPQESLQLSYTCVGSKWSGVRGPRLCNMTQLYPNPDESVTCVSQPHHDQASNSSAADSDSSAGDGEAATDSRSSSSSRAGVSGLGNATEAGHGLAAPAAKLAVRIASFGCPEPVTEVHQVLWPPHCVRYTEDARLHPDLLVSPQDLVVRKGWQAFIDAYSAFQDNGGLQSTGLAAQLRQQGVERVVVTGVALDYCVLYTALDAVAEGFDTVLVLDATLPVSAAGGADAVKQLRQAGVMVVDHASDLYVGLSEV